MQMRFVIQTEERNRVCFGEVCCIEIRIMKPIFGQKCPASVVKNECVLRFKLPKYHAWFVCVS
jgi:hypothetical protein